MKSTGSDRPTSSPEKHDSLSHEALKSIVLDPRVLGDLEKMYLAVHTGRLESYHALVNKYCSKRHHFSYRGMVARTCLAVLDHNNNLERSQATTSAGDLRYNTAYPKRTQGWIAKPVTTPKSYKWRLKLVTHVFNQRLHTSDAVHTNSTNPSHWSRSLWDLSDSDSKKVDVIWGRFKSLIEPKANFRPSRINLQKFRQTASESVDKFMIRCRIQRKKCRFRDALEAEERLIQQVIIGIRHTKIQEKLLSRDHMLTLDAAMDIPTNLHLRT